jgi:hypothetical protein
MLTKLETVVFSLVGWFMQKLVQKIYTLFVDLWFWSFTLFAFVYIRFDLIITVHGKKEKIASGLLNPFLSHLKAAQDQIDKGGYSIVLEPEGGSDATWFTKGTLERFDSWYIGLY